MKRASFQQCRRGIAQKWILLSVLAFVCSLAVSIVWHANRERHDRTARVRQRAQLQMLSVALDIFNREFSTCPPSDANDAAGLPYCGAMKLAGALMGQDLRGFHTRSAYRADGLDPNSLMPLYRSRPDQANLRTRKGPFLQAEDANAGRLVDIYGKGSTGPFPGNTLVLCDTYARMRPSGKKTGRPILYYRANPYRTMHDVNNPDNPQNIYSYKDNHLLVSLGVPGGPSTVHPLADPRRFYLNTRSNSVTVSSRPFRSDSYILISAGRDGLYGTADDICNFEWKYRKH